ncbi:MAG: F0F1 ATP synthase subunit B, partial [Gemmatimonadaceae bacterium]
ATTLLTVLAPALAIAQEHEAPPNLLSPAGGLMFWTLLIFIALILLLGKFAYKPLLAAVEAREQSLQRALDEARRDREEAAKLLEEHQRQLDAARGEAQRFIAEGRITAEKMKAEMLEATRLQQQELLERAKRDIEQEKVRAIAELRREAVDLAIAGASKVIEKNLDSGANRQLVESFLGSIPAQPKR